MRQLLRQRRISPNLKSSRSSARVPPAFRDTHFARPRSRGACRRWGAGCRLGCPRDRDRVRTVARSHGLRCSQVNPRGRRHRPLQMEPKSGLSLHDASSIGGRISVELSVDRSFDNPSRQRVVLGSDPAGRALWSRSSATFIGFTGTACAAGFENPKKSHRLWWPSYVVFHHSCCAG